LLAERNPLYGRQSAASSAECLTTYRSSTREKVFRSISSDYFWLRRSRRCAAIENGRVNLGVERAKVLARALKCHPAVLVFPGWDALESAA